MVVVAGFFFGLWFAFNPLVEEQILDRSLPTYVPGSLMVSFEENVSDERIKQIANEVGATSRIVVSQPIKVYAFQVEEGTEREIISALRRYAEVELAEQEGVYWGT